MRNAEKDEREMAERRERMLRTGFRIFAERGIDPVSMQEIANSCQLGIATLYRYYPTKQALVIAIGSRKWEEYIETVRRSRAGIGNEDATAAEEMTVYLTAFIDLYRDRKDLLRFNQFFNIYVQREGVTHDAMEPYQSAVGLMASRFHEIYRKALADRTLRTDVPETEMFSATLHLMLAAVTRYAFGLVYDAGVDPVRELELLRDMLLREYVTE